MFILIFSLLLVSLFDTSIHINLFNSIIPSKNEKSRKYLEKFIERERKEKKIKKRVSVKICQIGIVYEEEKLLS